MHLENNGNYWNYGEIESVKTLSRLTIATTTWYGSRVLSWQEKKKEKVTAFEQSSEVEQLNEINFLFNPSHYW